MVKLIYAPVFVRQFSRFEAALQDEVLEKIELFKDKNKHKSLKVHKLHGSLKGRYGFSVNYKIRIVFVWQNANEAAMLSIGDHDVYR